MTTKPERTDILIKGATVLTMDRAGTVIENGSVTVRSDRLIRVGGSDPCEKDFPGQVIDARGCIVMPGLVNVHTHLPMSLFRGLADDLPLMVWLNEHIFPAEGTHIRPETVYAATLLSCAELLLSGTTCCCDGYFCESSVADAVLKSGMRAVLGQGVIDYPAPGVPDPGLNVDAAVSFVSQWKEKHPRIVPSVFCHSPYTCSADTLKKAKRAARDHGVLFQIHAAETRDEWEQMVQTTGLSPVAYLHSLGVLDRHTLLVHCVHTDEKDRRIIRASGAAVAHAPESNMKLAAGVADIPDMMALGIPVGIGTDGSASNNNLDLFSEMDCTAKLHKVIRKDPTVMNAETVLSMATIGGARALGLDHLTGSLEYGKKADVIVVDTQKPHLTPMYCPLSHLVYAATGSDVRDVMVDGRVLVRNREVLSFDVTRVMQDVTLLARAIGKKPAP